MSREEIARIIAPNSWAFYDTALAPFERGAGAYNDEAWIYEETWSKAGLRSVSEVRSWLLSSPIDGASASSSARYNLRDSLAKADAILAALATPIKPEGA